MCLVAFISLCCVHRGEMSPRDHGAQSSWNPLHTIHLPFKGIFVWDEALPRIATARILGMNGCIDLFFFFHYI